MEKMTLLLPANTAEMLHLLSRETGQRIGDLVHEMALDRYMRHALDASETNDAERAFVSQSDLSKVSG
ncbi:hypothetical protein EDD53_2694 [Pacificibacter maritimus]|uniref:Uncharacterized protein n=1 Tax=Pacificibacter maritimus TaxID=762213 RepID=A0A3N4UCS5_9RHOB|nr:hypothetical protein [Pacificibacter maritimus]RPE63097.1 hypothetical protein EDD53_2694 [Pacificibacter maritimus]